MTEPIAAGASSSSSHSPSCPVSVTVAGLVGMFESQSTTDVKAAVRATRHICSVLGRRGFGEGAEGDNSIFGCSLELEDNDNGGGEMTGTKASGRPRQRKTAVYKRYWDGDGEDERRSGSGSFSSGVESDEDMVRFPCVERLIEMYANIIKQKEAETQTFLNSMVAGGKKGRGVRGAQNDDDKRLLDKTAVVAGDKTAYFATEVQLTTVSSTALVEQLDASSSGRIRESKSPASDDGWSTTQQSPYCSSDEETSTRVKLKMKNRDKVTRSSSSDSALGLDEDIGQQEQQQIINKVGKTRRLTLGVLDIPLRSALLPVAEPALLPTSDNMPTTGDHCPTVVRSKMILEAQLIELPLAFNSSLADSGSTEALGCPSNSISRRESAQSYVSDSGVDGVRYVRTPSVVVSDYSDDTMCGITLEEIEYLRRHRLRRASTDCDSDISAASSCSNLNYCGSSISALDGCDYQCGLRTPERKVSDCSTCSTLSCEEDDAVLRHRLQDLGLRPPAVCSDLNEKAHPELHAKKRPTKKKVCNH